MSHKTEQAEALPLAGVTVLEFCHTIMGPSCGLVLADMGANVIKIEPAPAGDHTRRLSGFAAGFFSFFNRNKRSLAIDIKTPAGKKLIHRLAGKADVVLENFAPGTMDRLGCGYDDLSAINPGLIYCSLKGFLSGPYEGRQALDEVVQYMAGLAYMTGPPGRPLRAGSSVVDIMGGAFGVIGILAAMQERQRTGKGQYIRSALFESTAFLMGQHMAGGAILEREVPPMPSRLGAWAIYETFETADKDQIFIGITSDNHWRRFCETFDKIDMLEDPRFKTNEDRVRERPEIRPVVAEVVGRHSKADMLRICEEINIPFAPVARTEDLFDDPQLNAGHGLIDTTMPTGQRTKLPRLPVEVGEHDFGLRRQPPQIGEHTREILAELGCADSEIAELEEQQVVVGPKAAAE